MRWEGGRGLPIPNVPTSLTSLSHPPLVLTATTAPWLDHAGLTALIYSGDHDMAVPHTGSEAWTSQLGNTLGVETPWAPWHTGDHQVGCWLIGRLFRCWVGLAVGWGGAGELGWLGLAACLSASRMDAKAQLATQLSSANCQLLLLLRCRWRAMRCTTVAWSMQRSGVQAIWCLKASPPSRWPWSAVS